jgi:Flp pilus assembly protein TadG
MIPARLRAAARRWAADERGAAIVEFAIVVPILLILVMGIIDFGRLNAVAASMAAAARDGARQAATATDLTDATQLSSIRARVVGAFQPLGGAALTSSNVTVTLNASQNVVVTVSGYTYRPITPIATLIGMQTITLNRSATFRWERGS